MSRAAASMTRKNGLLKEDNSSATFIIPGHIFGSGPEYVSEKVGREQAERQKKKREGKQVEEQLNELLGKKLENRARYAPPIPLPGTKKPVASSRTVVTVSKATQFRIQILKRPFSPSYWLRYKTTVNK